MVSSFKNIFARVFIDTGLKKGKTGHVKIYVVTYLFSPIVKVERSLYFCGAYVTKSDTQ